jgi:hypothetical protein
LLVYRDIKTDSRFAIPFDEKDEFNGVGAPLFSLRFDFEEFQLPDAAEEESAERPIAETDRKPSIFQEIQKILERYEAKQCSFASSIKIADEITAMLIEKYEEIQDQGTGGNVSGIHSPITFGGKD